MDIYEVRVTGKRSPDKQLSLTYDFITALLIHRLTVKVNDELSRILHYL
jgi:hypothetical protein